jgi:site-specific DNA recombinase
VGSRPKEVGQIIRVSAPELEGLVEGFLRQQFGVPGQGKAAWALVDAYIKSVAVLEDAVELRLVPAPGAAVPSQHGQTVSLPWSKQLTVAVKGVAHEPSNAPWADPKARGSILIAVAEARSWIDELLGGGSLKEIAAREGKGDRQIRPLLSLAFVAQQMVRRLIDGTLPIPTATGLAKSVPLCWSDDGTLNGAV